MTKIKIFIQINGNLDLLWKRIYCRYSGWYIRAGVEIDFNFNDYFFADKWNYDRLLMNEAGISGT